MVFFIIITVLRGRKKDSTPNSFGNVAHKTAVSSSARFLSLMNRYRFKRNKRKKKGLEGFCVISMRRKSCKIKKFMKEQICQ
jgi:hypothetical protein